MTRPILIQGGRIIDPAEKRDEVADLFILDGLITPAPSSLPKGTEVIDARGLVVTPGLIDLHVHLREPGMEAAETIESGSQAAARGGFTTIVAMPNTSPPMDTPERVAFVKKRGDEVGLVHVLPTAAITKGRAGDKLADLEALAEAGAVAFTDDGGTVKSREHMQEALRRAREIGLPVLDHAEDHTAHDHGVMHEGLYSREYGLPGIPACAESRIVLRDAELAEQTGASVHIQHVSSRDGIEIIRRFQSRGVPITGEATPHHLALTDADVRPDDTAYKMNPPLRSKSDWVAVRQAVIDGVLAAFATDHAPHTAANKAQGFLTAPFGIIGLETAVGVTYSTMIDSGAMDLHAWLSRWTTGPARILGLGEPSLKPGRPADVAVLDLTSRWVVNPDKFLSRSRNTPFARRRLKGHACCTVCAGRITWREH